MTLNKLEWLANFLVSKQIDSAAYGWRQTYKQMDSSDALSRYLWKYYKYYFFKYCNWIMDVGSTEQKILQVTQPFVDQGYSQLHLLVGRV